jgi:hypothetical protein
MFTQFVKALYAVTLLTLAYSVAAPRALAQGINNNWRQELNDALDDFKGCQKSAGDDCVQYTGRALQMVYRINDFYSRDQARYLTISEIADFLSTTNTWDLLGHSYEQQTLNDAQERANKNHAVVAVYTNKEGLGHVVLVTPGKLQPSGSWGLSVPNAASFFVTQPEKSFVDKGLSFAFGKNLMKDVLIYARKY